MKSKLNASELKAVETIAHYYAENLVFLSGKNDWLSWESALGFSQVRVVFGLIE